MRLADAIPNSNRYLPEEYNFCALLTRAWESLHAWVNFA